MFRTVLNLAAAAAIVLASPALAQQRPVAAPSPQVTTSQPAAQAAPAPAAQPAAPAVTAPEVPAVAAPVAESSSASKSVLTVPRELSPWSMFMSADVVVKGVMIGLAFASLVTWTIFIAKIIELS